MTVTSDERRDAMASSTGWRPARGEDAAIDSESWERDGRHRAPEHPVHDDGIPPLTARRKSYKPWSADEIDILMAHVGDHGPTWPGWESLLPGRSPDSIRGRIYRVVGADVPLAWRRQRKLAVASDPESDARAVMRLLRRGMTPSEADREIGLAPGTARRLVVRAWQLGVL